MSKKDRLNYDQADLASLDSDLAFQQQEAERRKDEDLGLLFGVSFRKLPVGLMETAKNAVERISTKDAPIALKNALAYILLLKIRKIYKINPLADELGESFIYEWASQLGFAMDAAKDFDKLLIWLDKFLGKDFSTENKKVAQILIGLPKAVEVEQKIPEQSAMIDESWKKKIKKFRGWDHFLKNKRWTLIAKELGTAIMELVVIICLSKEGQRRRIEICDEIMEALLVLDEKEICDQEFVLDLMIRIAREVIGEKYLKVLTEVECSTETLH